jgi:YnbE-like lipoprotein
VTVRLTPTREAARVPAKPAAVGQSTEQAMPEAPTGFPTAGPVAGVAMAASVALALGAAACTPTVRIEASDKPITINLNVKIDQEIRYRLDKDLEDAIASNPDLF